MDDIKTGDEFQPPRWLRAVWAVRSVDRELRMWWDVALHGVETPAHPWARR